jgi:hypothetical protein
MLSSAGTSPGERQLLGPQMTGRSYHNLSMPEYEIRGTYDVAIPMRDGIRLRQTCTGLAPLAVSPRSSPSRLTLGRGST